MEESLALPAGYHPAQTEEFPWDKLKGETPLHHKYFLVFRDLGPKRTVSGAARMLNRSPATLRELSSLHRWYERAGAWDKYQDFLFDSDMREERKRTALKQLEMADAMMEKLLKRVGNINPARITPQNIGLWADIVTKIQRLAVGLDARGPYMEQTMMGGVKAQGEGTNVTNITFNDNRKVSIEEKIKDYQSVFNELAAQYGPPPGDPPQLQTDSALADTSSIEADYQVSDD